MSVVWEDVGLVRVRGECEGSSMPREARRVEPGQGLRVAATSLVDGERQAAYGPPVLHWEKVAACWSAILGMEVTAHRAALCMAAMKLVRESHRADPENRIDCHGYLDIAGRCADAR